jgi:hypothetical protein
MEYMAAGIEVNAVIVADMLEPTHACEDTHSPCAQRNCSLAITLVHMKGPIVEYMAWKVSKKVVKRTA